jgi:transposase
MTWKPSNLTRAQMEERRLEGGRLLKAGKLSQAEIARQLGVSRATVSDWARKITEEGIRGLRKRKAKGGVSKLTKEQKQRLKRFLDRGALVCGFSTDRWTLQRIGELIEREFGVTYHPNYLNRLLNKLGFSPQKPLPRAVEQERELVKAWLERDLPRVKKVAAAVRRHRFLG